MGELAARSAVTAHSMLELKVVNKIPGGGSLMLKGADSYLFDDPLLIFACSCLLFSLLDVCSGEKTIQEAMLLYGNLLVL